MNKEVRRLQRLLKLLANQNPARFSSVDPGFIDGKLGAGTVVAIRNFQRIAGVPETGAVSRDLYTQILAAQSESPAPDFAPKKETVKSASPPKSTLAERGDAPASVPASQRFAQLGSIKDENRVIREWARLQQANPDQLKGRTPVIETADLGNRGTYYRILVGPFEDFERAKGFCDSLKERNQSCLVKKRAAATASTRNWTKQVATPRTGTPEKAVAPKKLEPVAVEESRNQSSHVEPADRRPPATPAEPPTTIVTTAETERLASLPQNPPPAPIEVAPITPASPENSGGANAENSVDAAFAKTAEPMAEQATEKKAEPLPAPHRKALTNIRPSKPQAGEDASASLGRTDLAVSNDAKPHAAPPATMLAQWLARTDRYSAQSYLGPTVAAAAGTVFGLLVLVWRQRRRRNQVFEAILVAPWFEEAEQEAPDPVETLPRTEDEPKDMLEELRSQFDAQDLVESRDARDAFLSGIAELKDVSTAGYSGEHAMLVNRKLNQLLSSDPDAYKAIFLNWIFLNHVADRISSSEYSMKRLDPRIQAEFRLLASLFKIHLLELEARHHVRQRLPNVFAALHDL